MVVVEPEAYAKIDPNVELRWEFMDWSPKVPEWSDDIVDQFYKAFQAM